MAAARLVIALAALSAAPGCGYVHFGRLPNPATTAGDMALVEALSSLSTEHKILKQELLLARKEGDALRVALERSGSASAPELAARLNETARELATLRASHAKLQAERGSGTAPNEQGTNARMAEVEEKLASSLRNYTQMQEENARLRRELDRARAENTTLAAQLKTAVAAKSEAEDAVAQLNRELLAQKEARAVADQIASAARAQLSAVIAASARPAEEPSERHPPAGAAPSLLQLAKAPPAGASATAELRTSTERLRTATAQLASRVHVVQPGETLESLARRYFGHESYAARIATANAALLGSGRDVTAGMQLTIPE